MLINFFHFFFCLIDQVFFQEEFIIACCGFFFFFLFCIQIMLNGSFFYFHKIFKISFQFFLLFRFLDILFDLLERRIFHIFSYNIFPSLFFIYDWLALFFEKFFNKLVNICSIIFPFLIFNCLYFLNYSFSLLVSKSLTVLLQKSLMLNSNIDSLTFENLFITDCETFDFEKEPLDLGAESMLYLASRNMLIDSVITENMFDAACPNLMFIDYESLLNSSIIKSEIYTFMTFDSFFCDDTVENMENVENIEPVEFIENIENVENIENIENMENVENLDDVENFDNIDSYTIEDMLDNDFDEELLFEMIASQCTEDYYFFFDNFWFLKYFCLYFLKNN